ncbi:MAG: low specificity L-threonine aldolase [Chthoniobacter sp.]|nr:low specificity L-threonine aldolase [Chthoniobacter sp.]
MPSPERPRQFASDNWAGICPEVAAALAEASAGHAPGYGADAWTAEAVRLIREVFETECDVFFVFNGTAANSLAVAAMCGPYESVLCHEHAHLVTDECGAPGFFAHGTTLKGLAGPLGKVLPAAVTDAALRRRDVHHPKVAALSLTQSTELGTVYTPDEIAALGVVAREQDLWLHMDGARFANALASLGVAPRQLTWQAGVDVLSFGGTKNGMPFGEALVFFDSELARDFAFRRKQGGQLASKTRFLAAPWVALLRDGAWLRHAASANARAAELERGLRAVPGVEVLYVREANAVFATMPPALLAGLRARGWQFYTDVGPDGAARLMGSWDTTEEDVAAFLHDATSLARA